MNPFAPLDRLADRFLSKGNRHLFDLSYDQSHVHHSLISVLVGGAFGVTLWAIFRGLSLELFARPLAVGMLGGVVAYAVRETLTRLQLSWSYKPWDGFLDVFVPFWIIGPWALAALTTGVPWWTGLVLYLAAAIVGWLYSFGRPRGQFLYSAAVVRDAIALLGDQRINYDKGGQIAVDNCRAELRRLVGE